MSDDRPMPTAELHRGVRVFALQPHERVDLVVKPEIDAVFAMSDAVALVEYAGDARHSPEARLFAAARVEALWQLAAEGRAIRPPVNLDYLRAVTAGLDSLNWASPWRYGSLLDLDRAIKRETPLTDAELGR